MDRDSDALRPAHRYGGAVAAAVAVLAAPIAGVALLVAAVTAAPTHHRTALAPAPDWPRGDAALAVARASLAPATGATTAGLTAGDWSARPFAFPAEMAAHPSPGIKIYVVPLGSIGADTVDLVVDAIAFVAGTRDVALLPRRPLPGESWNPATAMYDAERVLGMMRSLRPRDGYRLVAVTDADLYASELRFLFGLASATHDVAIVSALRLEEQFWDRDSDWDLYRWRLFKILAHELGHTLGLPHCDRSSCLMHAIRSLADADAAPPRLCDLCRRWVDAALADPDRSAPTPLPLSL
ncbi:MAG TPA: archaemetzincin [Myxococcota bacterium]|nr:archaemetzincin [Myxococcota bacterium]